jgi:hypothetical protein
MYDFGREKKKKKVSTYNGVTSRPRSKNSSSNKR